MTYKLLFILSKNIVPSRSYRYIRDRAFPVTRLPPPIYTKFDVNKGIYIWVLASTLAHSASEINKALSVTYKLLFILSKNIVPNRSYRYIRDRAFPVTRLPPPMAIYTKFDVNKGIYIWVPASTLAHSASEINKALSVTYKLLFILSKNIVPSRSYRYIRDSAFPVTSLPAPLLVRFGVKQPYIYIWVLASTLAHSASEINKTLSVTYKLLFILSKNIVPSRSYRYIRDRAFPVTACHPLYIQSLM